MRQAGDRFRLLAETVPEKIFTAKPNGERDYFNQRWLEYAGLPLEQLRDWGWTQLVHPEDLAENRRVWKRCVATGEAYYFEQRFRRFDGEYRSHISRAVALKNPEGKVLMWVGSNTDIHDIKESDRRKDEFLAMLAHELRNPLSALSNDVHIVRHAGDGPKVENAIGVMERQAGQMARLVDELLDVSRVSRGRIELHRQRLDVASTLNHAVDAAQPLLESKEQQLTTSLPSHPIYADADPTRLAQIVGNLLSNASKFTERQGVIRLEVAAEDTQVAIRVKDNGIGIAEEQLPHVFEAFMQVDTSRDRSQGGLGLGLTLAKRLVEMHGGTIEAHSGGLGLGSEFVVRLPMSTKPPPRPASKPTNSQRAINRAARRVLVADDNPDAASTLAMLLEASGHEVHTAHDGIEAVEEAARLKPDVIILEVGMPGLDGYEAARRIRKQRRDNELVLISLTGWGQEEDKRRSKQAGFDFHLVKPVDISALQELVESAPLAK